MTDQGSTYAILQSAPVMVSPLYRLPKKIIVASELKLLPNDITQFASYPFVIEREALKQVDISRKQSLEQEERVEQLRQRYKEDKINQQKVAARKIAPGFLDTDTRILKPEQTYSSTTDGDEFTDLPSIAITEKQFDYLKFEQGLAPNDPWDTPENDMAALRSILGSPKTAAEEYTAPKQTSTAPVYPSLYQHQQQQQQQQQYPPVPQQPAGYQNEGVYWNFGQGNSYSPQHKHSPLVPALPPKVLNGGASSPRTTTPPIPPVPSNYRSQIPTPPPLPPPPCSNNDLDPLINELGNMGFSRAQAIDALEKNDHDLIKATHFLLDQAG